MDASVFERSICGKNAIDLLVESARAFLSYVENLRSIKVEEDSTY